MLFVPFVLFDTKKSAIYTSWLHFTFFLRNKKKCSFNLSIENSIKSEKINSQLA